MGHRAVGFFSRVPNLEATADLHEMPAEALDLED